MGGAGEGWGEQMMTSEQKLKAYSGVVMDFPTIQKDMQRWPDSDVFYRACGTCGALTWHCSSPSETPKVVVTEWLICDQCEEVAVQFPAVAMFVQRAVMFSEFLFDLTLKQEKVA